MNINILKDLEKNYKFKELDQICLNYKYDEKTNDPINENQVAWFVYNFEESQMQRGSKTFANLINLYNKDSLNKDKIMLYILSISSGYSFKPKGFDYFEWAKKINTENLSKSDKLLVTILEQSWAIKQNYYKKKMSDKDLYHLANNYIDACLKENKQADKLVFLLERFVLNWSNKMLTDFTKKTTSTTIVNPVSFTMPKKQHKQNGINIAFISRDFYNRPTGQLLKQFLKKKPENSRFRFNLYQIGCHRKDDINSFLKNSSDSYKEYNYQSDIIKDMPNLDIDIIIDLMGLMPHNLLNILLLKLVPLQICWLTYPCTMGTDKIDYIIGDKYVIPESQKNDYSEKVIYLPESYQINDDYIDYKNISKMKLMMTNLPKKEVIIGFMNYSYKIDDKTISLWAKALKKCPNAAIIILITKIHQAQNIMQKWYDLGMNDSNISFWTPIDKRAHLKRISRYLDFCVDSIYCNSHTTGSDILSAGKPLVTLSHKTFAGQVAASLLSNIDMEELIAKNRDEYINKIVKLSNDKKYLTKIKKQIQYKIRKHNLFNSKRYLEHLLLGIETAYDNKFKNNENDHIYVDKIEEFKTISFENKTVLLRCDYSTCKIFIDNQIEILINESCHEIWVNGKSINNLKTFPYLKNNNDKQSQDDEIVKTNEYELKLEIVKDIVKIFLNDVYLTKTKKSGLLKNIKTNAEII